MVQAQLERVDYIHAIEKVVDHLGGAWHERLIAEDHVDSSSLVADRIDSYLVASDALFEAVQRPNKLQTIAPEPHEDAEQATAWAPLFPRTMVARAFGKFLTITPPRDSPVFRTVWGGLTSAAHLVTTDFLDSPGREARRPIRHRGLPG